VRLRKVGKVGKVGKVVFVYHSCDFKSKKGGKSQSILLFYAFVINLSQRLPKKYIADLWKFYLNTFI
jgi:hypothetical protein